MNKEQLLEDVKFPLKLGEGKYKNTIFDSNREIIAEIETTGKYEIHPFEKLLGDFKEVNVKKQGNTYFEYQGDIYDQVEGQRIGCVGNCTRLMSRDNPFERQDNIPEYILIILNDGEY